MFAPDLVVVVLLLGEPEPAPSWRELDAKCTELRRSGAPAAVAAHACRRAFDAVPDGPQAFDRRSLLLGSAHALYRRAQATGPDLSLACTDAAMLRTFAAQLDTLPPDERPGDRADVAKALSEVDPALSAKCPGASEGTTGSPQPPQPALVRPTPPSPAANPRRGSEADDTHARPQRPLRVAGGAVLGVGLGFGAAMIGALVRGAELRNQADAMRDELKGNAVSGDIDQKYNTTVAHGERADRLAIGLGITAAALSGVGVALLVVDRRRISRRLALAPLVLPTAGVRLALEF